MLERPIRQHQRSKSNPAPLEPWRCPLGSAAAAHTTDFFPSNTVRPKADLATQVLSQAAGPKELALFLTINTPPLTHRHINTPPHQSSHIHFTGYQPLPLFTLKSPEGGVWTPKFILASLAKA